MCDYCGCRQSGPTADLAAEHVRLQILSQQLLLGLRDGQDISATFSEFTTLLDLHAAKEEVGLFPKVRSLRVLDDQIDQLITEHDTLHSQLEPGPSSAQLRAALKLLAQHIEDEEFDLFPHVIHALDPEDWDEIELAHRAVETVFARGDDHDHQHPHSHDQPHPHNHDHQHPHSHDQPHSHENGHS